MKPRVIAIGDIHGCATALRALVDAIGPRADDVLIPLGDCVDRGPESYAVIELLLGLRDRCQLVPLLGNHEEMMLNFLDGRPQPDNWLLCGGAATLQSYERSSPDGLVPLEHIDFIRTWRDYWESDGHFFVHGAYHTAQPLVEQRWQNWRWLSLHDSVPGPHVSGKQAIVGHTSQKEGQILDLGHLKCIDTFCWGGGWLTGLDVTTGQVWQADLEGRLNDGAAANSLNG